MALCLCRGRAAVQVGDAFPSLDLAGAAAGPVRPRQGEVVLVDFWASWCAPCKASFPAYARLYADFHPRGFTIVAVSADENEAAFEAFIKRTAPPFAAIRDAAHHLAAQVGVPAMPTSYLLGRDGRVRFVHEGFHGASTEQALRREIETLLAETEPSP